MTKTAPLIKRSPSRAESAAARRSLNALRKRAGITVGDAPAPASAVAALERVLEALANGGGVAVVPLDAEITTQEAADLLGLSRPSLVKLLEAGAIPFRTLGSHRRINAADIMAYRDLRDAERRSALDTLVAENQRLGLYDD
jgi:excisionase family DNA binding protein